MWWYHVLRNCAGMVVGCDDMTFLDGSGGFLMMTIVIELQWSWILFIDPIGMEHSAK